MSYNFILISFEIILPQPLLKKLKAFLAFNFVLFVFTKFQFISFRIELLI